MVDDFLVNKVHQEIVGNGLRSELKRIMSAQGNLRFYEGDFSRAPSRPRGNESYDSNRYPRNSNIMQRVVDVLSMNLYAEGPVRKLVPKQMEDGVQKAAKKGSGKDLERMPTDPVYDAATSWLHECYQRNKMDSMWQEADKLTCIAQAAMFEVKVTDDPELPIDIDLWDASEFCVWVERRKSRKPALVALLDIEDDRNRLRLYSDEFIRTYMTARSEAGPGEDILPGREYKFVDEISNPYGMLNFSFVHFNLPVRRFWNGSPGDNLRAVNDGIDFKMTETFDCIRYNLRPPIILQDVRPDWKPPSPIRPGDVWNLAAASNSTREEKKSPDAKYLQADPSFVEADWQDTQSFIDHTLEMNGVPPSVIRMTQDSVRSGVAIIAEQLPVIQWAKKRQRPFGFYEEDLVRLVLRIGARHLGSQEDEVYQATAADLEAVSRHPGLVLKWPNMYPRIPGEDTDRADEFRLEKRLASKTILLMERECLTREEAEERLEEIAEDLKREQELFSEVEPDLGAALGGIGAHELQVAAENENGEE